MSKILVIVANGFIGKNLCKKLLNSDHRVEEISRNTIFNNKPIGDFEKFNNWSELLATIDVVIHLVGFVNKKMQMKASKTWDMQLHWLRDKENMKSFKVFWDKGSNQGGYYWTKHPPTVHHRRIRLERKYVRDMSQT